MYTLNKVVGYLISPAGFGIMLVSTAVLARVLGRRRLAGWAVLLALANFWIWSTPWMTQRMGAALEAEFLVDGRVPGVELLPPADAIVLHGGGMGLATNIGYQAEMWSNADRVWHAARLWRDQGERRREKGESAEIKILVTSAGTDLSTGPLLADLGIPKDAIIYDFGPRNTEEEAKAIARMFECSECSNAEKASKVLVVTSAWHMKRTMLMYQKYAPNVEAIPAPCDFENTIRCMEPIGIVDFIPSPWALLMNCVSFHEWVGIWGYKLFR